MKKIIPAVAIALLLCSCTAKNLSFIPKTDFTYNSVITIKDFSYNAVIKYKNGIVYVNPTTTHASGMTMKCDGKSLCFMQKSYSHSIPMSKAPLQNPASVLYLVLSSLDSSSRYVIDSVYTYKGKIAFGEYSLTQNNNGDYVSLVVSDLNLKIDFAN